MSLGAAARSWLSARDAVVALTATHPTRSTATTPATTEMVEARCRRSAARRVLKMRVDLVMAETVVVGGWLDALDRVAAGAKGNRSGNCCGQGNQHEGHGGIGATNRAIAGVHNRRRRAEAIDGLSQHGQ